MYEGCLGVWALIGAFEECDQSSPVYLVLGFREGFPRLNVRYQPCRGMDVIAGLLIGVASVVW